MSETFVVADAHGRLDLIQALLEGAGAERGAGRTIVQLGDLANCVSTSIQEDLACLQAARDLFDVLLIGNHEHPYLGGPAFKGFWRDPEVENAVRSLFWRPCLAVDGILVSHAGVVRGVGAATWSAHWMEQVLCSLWRDDPRAEVFSAIGKSRGGSVQYGGILWADESEPKTDVFPQIVGHTPGPEPRIRPEPTSDEPRLGPGEALYLDLGAAKGGGGWPDGNRIAGCWIRDGMVEVFEAAAAAESVDS